MKNHKTVKPNPPPKVFDWNTYWLFNHLNLNPPWLGPHEVVSRSNSSETFPTKGSHPTTRMVTTRSFPIKATTILKKKATWFLTTENLRVMISLEATHYQQISWMGQDLPTASLSRKVNGVWGDWMARGVCVGVAAWWDLLDGGIATPQVLQKSREKVLFRWHSSYIRQNYHISPS